MYDIICKNEKMDYDITFRLDSQNDVARFLKDDSKNYESITLIEILPNCKQYVLAFRNTKDCYINTDRCIKENIVKYFKEKFVKSEENSKSIELNKFLNTLDNVDLIKIFESFLANKDNFKYFQENILNSDGIPTYLLYSLIDILEK